MKINNKWVGIAYRYVNQTPGEDFERCYVGVTPDEKTRRQCWGQPSKAYAGRKIAEARIKFGIKAFIYEVLEIIYANSEQELEIKLDERETYWIAYYDSYENGYNSNRGGSGYKGVTPSQESIRKGVATRMANGSYAHTDATKQKLSLKLKGRRRDPIAVAKTAEKNRGKKRTPEQRAAQSLRQKGRTMSPEARAKSSATKKGKPHPISAQGQANIDAARYKIPIEVTDLQGNTKVYESMKAAAEATDLKVGSVSNFLKSGNYSKNGYRFSYKDGIKNLPKQQQKP